MILLCIMSYYFGQTTTLQILNPMSIQPSIRFCLSWNWDTGAAGLEGYSTSQQQNRGQEILKKPDSLRGKNTE